MIYFQRFSHFVELYILEAVKLTHVLCCGHAKNTFMSLSVFCNQIPKITGVKRESNVYQKIFNVTFVPWLRICLCDYRSVLVCIMPLAFAMLCQLSPWIHLYLTTSPQGLHTFWYINDYGNFDEICGSNVNSVLSEKRSMSLAYHVDPFLSMRLKIANNRSWHVTCLHDLITRVWKKISWKMH